MDGCGSGYVCSQSQASDPIMKNKTDKTDKKERRLSRGSLQYPSTSIDTTLKSSSTLKSINRGSYGDWWVVVSIALLLMPVASARAHWDVRSNYLVTKEHPCEFQSDPFLVVVLCMLYVVVLVGRLSLSSSSSSCQNDPRRSWVRTSTCICM